MQKSEKEGIKYRKASKGITLIALVVTIVVLLILAGITINLLFSNGGIFKTAEDAADAWNEAVTNEQASLDNLADQIANLVNGTGGGTVNPGEDTEIPDVLERYILGEDKTGVLATDIFDTNTMKFKDNDIIPDASTSLTFLGMDTVGDKIHITFQYNYNNETYIGIGSSSTYMTEELIKQTQQIKQEETFSNIYTTTQQYTDSAGKTAWIPEGFAVGTSENINKIDNGLVITNQIDGTNHSIGNEFVWIPVSAERLGQMYTEETATLSGGTGVTTSIYSKTSGAKPGETGYREPDLVVGGGSQYDANSTYQTILGADSTQKFAQDMVNEYQEIHDSIEQYGGFYIGRYELTGDTTSPTVAKDGTVLTNTNWYNLKAACIKIVNNADKQENEITAKTTMMYGNQWDEVCNWLQGKGYDINNSTNWGNYSDNTATGHGTKQTAGFSESWKANNIYDFAGNCWEWTQEAHDAGSRVSRGGVCYHSGSSYPASDRDNNGSSNDLNSFISTRPTLYIMQH